MADLLRPFPPPSWYNISEGREWIVARVYVGINERGGVWIETPSAATIPHRLVGARTGVITQHHEGYTSYGMHNDLTRALRIAGNIVREARQQ